MITINDCKVTIFMHSKKIAFIQLPKNPDYDTMMALGRGKPSNDTTSLAISYKLAGIDYYLHR